MRNRQSGNFTVVTNDVIMNSRLSAKAKGIYLYLQSRPDDWQFYFDEILSHFTDGERSLRSGLKELEDQKLLIKTQLRGQGKFEPCLYILNPTDEDIALYCDDSTVTTFCVDGKCADAKCAHAKCSTTNTNNTNTEKTNTESTSKKKEKSRFSFDQFRDIFLNCEEFKHGFGVTGLEGWTASAFFKINKQGLLVSVGSGRVLNKDEAYQIWQHLYQKFIDGNIPQLKEVL